MRLRIVHDAPRRCACRRILHDAPNHSRSHWNNDRLGDATAFSDRSETCEVLLLGASATATCDVCLALLLLADRPPRADGAPHPPTSSCSASTAWVSASPSAMTAPRPAIASDGFRCALAPVLKNERPAGASRCVPLRRQTGGRTPLFQPAGSMPRGRTWARAPSREPGTPSRQLPSGTSRTVLASR